MNCAVAAQVITNPSLAQNSPIHFTYYANTGTATAWTFEAKTGAANPFNGFHTPQNTGMTLVDIDAVMIDIIMRG